jgi:hypothetical protein
VIAPNAKPESFREFNAALKRCSTQKLLDLKSVFFSSL